MGKIWAAVKTFFAKLAEFFENENGGFSSRRLAGLAFVVVGIVGWFMGKDSTICAIIMGYGGVLLGLTTADPKLP